MSYKKTAKDLAHERDMQKLRTRIKKLQNEVAYWKSSAEKAHESASCIEARYFEAIEHLNMSAEAFEEHVKETKTASDALTAFNIVARIHNA